MHERTGPRFESVQDLEQTLLLAKTTERAITQGLPSSLVSRARNTASTGTRKMQKNRAFNSNLTWKRLSPADSFRMPGKATTNTNVPLYGLESSLCRTSSNEVDGSLVSPLNSQNIAPPSWFDRM